MLDLLRNCSTSPFSSLTGGDDLRSTHLPSYFLFSSSISPLFLSPGEHPALLPRHFELQHPILKQPHDSISQPGSLGQDLDGMEARGSVRVLALWVGVRTRAKWVWLASECPDDTAGTYPAVRHTPCKYHYRDTQPSRNFKYASYSCPHLKQVQLSIDKRIVWANWNTPTL